MPIYVALGNNDSGCGDYQLDANSEFLALAGDAIVEGLPRSEREEARKQFGVGGYYSVNMAAPMLNTRLVVVNDLFLSTKYNTCAGKPDPAAGAAQMEWLEQQLKAAREANQKVWVMGHIPPGVDPYTTVSKFRDVCGGQPPVSFLASSAMVDLLTANADIVPLALFGHTHMDEMRLLQQGGEDVKSPKEDRVALKQVPSISPVDGNKPAFTIAFVDPGTARLKDYEVIEGADKSGAATSWSKEYDFAQTYNKAEFSAATVEELVEEFKADRFAARPESVAYIRNYYVGDRSPELSPFWPEYVCSLGNQSGKAFAACVCSTPK
jgi:sphingomyelin phosphodiesterase acid-like 3